MDFVFLGVEVPVVDTASNSAIKRDTDLSRMTENQLTVKLLQVNIDVKLSKLDDVTTANFTADNDLCKLTAPKLKNKKAMLSQR